MQAHLQLASVFLLATIDEWVKKDIPSNVRLKSRFLRKKKNGNFNFKIHLQHLRSN
jgi:hypothetical protein